ncbi:MAG: aquaporin family protein [Alphaproteobacteria bacterium]|nr:aquaporin family protein [Alphaproteobacteria bacterium]
MNSRASRALAEAVGSALLLAAVVGSGIMGERLAGGNNALALLANAIATAGVLYALIAAFGPVSGAHFNPLVTFAFALRDPVARRDAPLYVAAQIAGAVIGVFAAHAMFGLDILETGSKLRTGPAQWFAEFVATFGLLAIILLAARKSPGHVPAAVAGYIAGAYWFTASTSFANPAVTIARALTDTFAGIRPEDAPGFIAAQFLGALAATVLAHRMNA